MCLACDITSITWWKVCDWRYTADRNPATELTASSAKQNKIF